MITKKKIKEREENRKEEDEGVGFKGCIFVVNTLVFIIPSYSTDTS